MAHWNYDASSAKGPQGWSKYYETGERQSPINIVTSELYQSLANVTCCNGRLLCHDQDHKHLVDKTTTTTTASNNNNNNNHLTNGNQIRQVQPQHHYRRPHLDSIGEDERDDDANSWAHNNTRSHRQPISRNSRLHEKGEQLTKYCASKRKLFLGYPRYLDKIRVHNTGHNWQVNIPAELSVHTLICGPSFGDREYRLAQFHCHWGQDGDQGSEHQINGKSFAAEIHFVHWNCSQFDSFEEASKERHGLAVLAVLVQAIEGEHNRNKHLDRLVEALEHIRAPNSSREVLARLDMKRLFPANRWQYATYEGSLTTPPLSEVVDWLVFLNPIQCNTAQVDQFRHLQCHSSDGTTRLVNNCRPIQPTNGRLVTVWSHH